MSGHEERIRRAMAFDCRNCPECEADSHMAEFAVEEVAQELERVADVWRDSEPMPSAKYMAQWLVDRAKRTRKER